MASRQSSGSSPISKLWQLPLLLLSLGLFGYAAYIFIDPRAGVSIDQKIEIGRIYLRHERPEAAIDQLNKIITTEKLDTEHEGAVHLLLAQGIQAAQLQKHIDLPANRQQIVEQARLALNMGVKDSCDIERLIAESYEALNQSGLALQHYRQAMGLDATHALRLQRKVIDLQLASNDPGPAEASLEGYLKTPDLSDSERAWALCEQARLLVDRGEFVAARNLLDHALKLETDPSSQGQANYYLGYCAYKLGDGAEAERLLRASRDQLKVQNPLDAEAAYLLGKIFEEKGDSRTAESFYQDVLVSHPDARVATPSLLGRGVCRLLQAQDDPGLTDLHDLTNQIDEKAYRDKYRAQAVAGISTGVSALSSRGNFQGALELLADEQQLQPNPPADFFSRLGGVYEQRAEQLEKSIDGVDAAEKIRRSKQIRDFRTKAGDAYVACSRALTLADDKGYGEALWKGVDLYDRAANIQSVLASLELFVTERPDDSLASAALLRLGRAYQAAGLFDKAIAAFQRNQFRYPNSLAASKSAVPLAQAYIAKGPEFYVKAESVLKSVVENNPLLTPEAEEFKQALFELANLYYRTNRYENAVAKLEELTARYPNDERLGQLLFLMADSYRKSATLLGDKVSIASAGDSKQTAAIDLAEAAAARKDRLTKARSLYDRVTELYRNAPPRTEVDRLYSKLSNFYRADCAYDLGQYEEAIRLYDAAAFRYQDDASSLAAYVQIVNAYYALGKPEEAKAANERAKWLLKRMPADSFTDGNFAMPKEYWENQLRWTSQSGMW